MSSSMSPGFEVRKRPRVCHLCVDMQVLFGPRGLWHTPWITRVLPRVQAIAQALAPQTVFTRFIPPPRVDDAHGAWVEFYTRWPQLTREHLDPAQLELLPELRTLVPPARVLDKSTYSPFFGRDLRAMLGSPDDTALIVTGVETDMCVLACVLGAVDAGYRTVVVQDAICSGQDDTHDALITLYQRRFSCQIELLDTRTVLARHAGRAARGAGTAIASSPASASGLHDSPVLPPEPSSHS